MNKEQVLIYVKPNCDKCIIAKELAEKLKDKYTVKILSIDTLDGLTDFTLLGVQYPPTVVYKDKIYTSIKFAEKELLNTQ